MRADVQRVTDAKRPRLGVLIVLCECGGRMYAGKSPPRVTHYYCERGCLPGKKVSRPA